VILQEDLASNRLPGETLRSQCRRLLYRFWEDR
jgi:hypothetical protein